MRSGPTPSDGCRYSQAVPESVEAKKPGAGFLQELESRDEWVQL